MATMMSLASGIACRQRQGIMPMARRILDSSNLRRPLVSLTSQCTSSTTIHHPSKDPPRFLSSSSTVAAADGDGDDDASWYIWGSNKNGYLDSLLETKEQDDDDDDDSATPPTVIWEPTPISWSPPAGSSAKIQSVVCGPTSGKSNSTAIILDNGDVYVAGDNAQGHLGLGHTNPVPTLTKLDVDMAGHPLPPISQVVFGSAPNMALITTEGDLYTVGFGGSLVQGTGWLGHGNGDSYTTPKRVESLVEDGCYAQAVVLGDAHMTVLTTEGEVLSAGTSSYGRLGNGETHGTDQLYLEPVEILQAKSGSDMTLVGGKSFTIALMDGILYGWGRNHKGQLGTGFGMAVDMYSMENVPTPMDAMGDNELLHQEVVKVSAGPSHAACVTRGGELYVWGMGTYLEPHKVQQVLHTKIIDVYCGGNDTTYALSETGQLYVWGKGGKKSGMLGLSETTIAAATSLNLQHQPQLLKSLAMEHAVLDVSVGNMHVAAKCVLVPIEIEEDGNENKTTTTTL